MINCKTTGAAMLLFLALVVPVSAYPVATYQLPVSSHHSIMYLNPWDNQWYSAVLEGNVLTISTDIITPEYYLYPTKEDVNAIYSIATNSINSNEISVYDQIRLSWVWWNMPKIKGPA